MRKFKICFPRVVQCDINKHFAAFGSILYGFSLKNGEKQAFLFISRYHSRDLSEPNCLTSFKLLYYMAGSASGQDKANPVF